jgi:hypothetical protein
MSNRLNRLKRLPAIALGLYMARRIMGESAEVQKRRLLRLAELITIEESYK